MKKKYIIIAIVIGLIWIGAIGFLVVKSKNKKNDDNSSQGVERYVIPEEKKIFLNGTVEPEQSKVFYKDMTKGENYTIHKDNGEYVNKGSLLITYKNEDISNQIVDLKDRIKDLKNEKKKSNNVSEEQGMENQELATQSIEDQIKSTEKELSKLKKKQYSYEYAPFAGKVYKKNNAKGGENQELLKLRSTDYYVKSQVSERELEKIKQGQEVDVLILANDKNVKGEIKELSYEPETESPGVADGFSNNTSVSSYPIKISLNSQEGVVNGYHVQGKIKLSNKELKIPTSAIKSDDNKQYVYLIKDNKLAKQLIKTKNKKGKYTVVTSGLKEKDEIVKVINEDMKEGQEIE